MRDKILLESLAIFTDFPTWLSNVNSSESRGDIIQRLCPSFCCQGYKYEKQKNKLSAERLKDNMPRVIMLLIYILANLGLMVYVIIYRAVVQNASVFVVIARIGGMLLNFNCALIIVLMLRRTILIIRTTPLHKILSIDDHIDFHKFVGRFIGVLSIVHTIAHAINFVRLKGEYNT